jgi:hypothetical protein
MYKQGEARQGKGYGLAHRQGKTFNCGAVPSQSHFTCAFKILRTDSQLHHHTTIDAIKQMVDQNFSANGKILDKLTILVQSLRGRKYP